MIGAGKMERARILVADDSVAILGVFSELLREARIDVETATSREAAGALLEAGTFQVPIIDVRMPGGGAAALGALRARFPELKLIVCSGFLSDVEVERFHRLGANAVLEKTSAPSTLPETIRGLLPPEMVVS
jgi:CheY-like chemotaxis protein